ncbi:hypothetical protein AAG570_007915 [Ranatra chinensis]|uniref:type I protein arginine methyltransferase n=1 Tax=Ranatra chinensis TaxID=642074 RepID=A0ABD0YF06_9HEMI
MLKDEYRLNAYKSAISRNKPLFKDKIVLDIGAGTGILSIFCAKAGARKVFAVEANLKMAEICQKVIDDNNLKRIIKVYQGEIENIKLPQKVDIIISEWMGHYLFHEGMIDSVLHARKYLKDGGKMFPETCHIYASMCELPDQYDFWKDVHGVDMSAVGEAYRKSSCDEPHIQLVDKKSLLCDPNVICSINMYDIDPDSLKEICADNLAVMKRNGSIQGVCIWFSVDFPNGISSERIYLSTSPYQNPTHWKQTVIVLPREVVVEKSEPILYKLIFSKMAKRVYQISVQFSDPSDIAHPITCNCFYTKCIVSKTHLNGLQQI